MVDDRSEVLETLATHTWPAGFEVDVDVAGAVLRVGATPLGRVDVAVVAGIAIGIPAVVVLLFATVLGVVAAVLFAVAVVALGFQRFKGAQRVTVDLAAGRVHVEHANPRVARRLGLPARSVGFSEVAAVDVTRVLTGSRTEPHGRRVALRLADGTRPILAEFHVAATALVFARAVAALLDAPIREL